MHVPLLCTSKVIQSRWLFRHYAMGISAEAFADNNRDERVVQMRFFKTVVAVRFDFSDVLLHTHTRPIFSLLAASKGKRYTCPRCERRNDGVQRRKVQLPLQYLSLSFSVARPLPHMPDKCAVHVFLTNSFDRGRVGAVLLPKWQNNESVHWTTGYGAPPPVCWSSVVEVCCFLVVVVPQSSSSFLHLHPNGPTVKLVQQYFRAEVSCACCLPAWCTWNVVDFHVNWLFHCESLAGERKRFVLALLLPACEGCSWWWWWWWWENNTKNTVLV